MPVPTLLQWPAVAATNFSFAFSYELGLTYVIEFKSVLTDKNWTPLRTNAGSGERLTNLVPIAGSESCLCRVRVE